MILSMQSESYEKLIKQIVYIEENMDDIAGDAADSGSFSSKSAAEEFFDGYICKVEALFQEIRIVDKETAKSDMQPGSLPFIVLDSSFALMVSGKVRKFCHLSYDILCNSKDLVNHIYFLSETGLALLMKEAGHYIRADIGEGHVEYRIGSITIK